MTKVRRSITGEVQYHRRRKQDLLSVLFVSDGRVCWPAFCCIDKIPGETILKKDFFRCLSFRDFCPWSLGAIISKPKAGGHDEQSYSPHVS